MIQSGKNIIWALYARKSQENEDRQVQSIQDQEKYMGDLAKREKLNIKIVIVDAKSAKIKNNRDGFTRLMKMVEKGQITGILTWKTDRLSRNPVESGMVMEALQLGKIKCIKTSDRNHYPEDNALIFAVEQGMANQYSRDLANNVRRGMVSKAQKGWWPIQPPIGYLNSKGEGEEAIIQDKECFAIVRKMWDMLLSGTQSIPEIHRMARDEWGLRTHKRKRVGGKPLALSYMYILFSNIFYTGNFMYAGQFYKGKHTSMITMDEFDRVQVMLGKKGRPRPQKHDFPYTGIITCGECHACITATEKKKMVKSKNGLATYTYYHCTRRKRDIQCSQPPVTANNLEKEIRGILSEYAIGKPYYETGLQVLEEMHQGDNTAGEQVYEIQKQHVKDIERKLGRILEFAINGTLSEEAYNEQKQRLEIELEKQKIKLAECQNEATDYMAMVGNVFHFLYSATYILAKGGNQAKKSILSNLGSNYQIFNRKLLIDKHPWLSKLKESELLLSPEIERFELAKTLGKQKEIEAYAILFPKLCSQIKDVRTILMRLPEPPNIPNLSSLISNIKPHDTS